MLGFLSAAMTAVEKVIHQANELQAVARAMAPRDPVARLKYHLFLTHLQNVDYDALSDLNCGGKIAYLYQSFALFIADRISDPRWS